MTRIRRYTTPLVGMVVLLLLWQVITVSSDMCMWALYPHHTQACCAQSAPETLADCGDVANRTGCKTIWELLVCSSNNVYTTVANAANASGVDFASVLDNENTSLTLTIVNDTVFNNTGIWPGVNLATPGRPPPPGGATDGMVVD